MTPSEIMKFHHNTLVWDNHGCLPLRSDESYLPQLERYRLAGVNVVSINISFDLVDFETGIKVVSKFRAWIKRNNDHYALVNSVSDIDRNAAAGKLSVVFDIEGIASIGENLDLLALYYDLGVRWTLLAYNRDNPFAGGCMGEGRGLTPMGRSAVRKMNELGIVVCCSHMSEAASLEVMSISTNPVIFSHSNAGTLHNNPRNISDTLIQACAETDGVIGVNGVGVFLGDRLAGTGSLIRHIEYIANLVGVDHVGLGLDYMFDEDEIMAFFNANRDIFPRNEYGDRLELIQIEQIPLITRGLFEVGFTTEEVGKILGGNWMRVAQRIWR
jgi:membrane dipeptidase